MSQEFMNAILSTLSASIEALIDARVEAKLNARVAQAIHEAVLNDTFKAKIREIVGEGHVFNTFSPEALTHALHDVDWGLLSTNCGPFISAVDTVKPDVETITADVIERVQGQFADAVEKGIENYDFDSIVESSLGNIDLEDMLDLDEKINNGCAKYDFSGAVSDFLGTYQGERVLSDAIENAVDTDAIASDVASSLLDGDEFKSKVEEIIGCADLSERVDAALECFFNDSATTSEPFRKAFNDVLATVTFRTTVA